MATKITQLWRQGRHLFTPGQIIKFGDPDGDAFLESVGAGESASDDDAHFELSEEECQFDPVTVFPDGKKVLESPIKDVPEDSNPEAQPGFLQPKDVTVVAGAGEDSNNG